MFESRKTASAFHFKDHIPKELISGVVYKFQSGLYNETYYCECVRHLSVKIGEDIGISSLAKKKVKPTVSVISDHLILCNHPPSFESFCVLTKENRIFALELNERLLMKTNKPFLNGNIRSPPIYLLHRV